MSSYFCETANYIWNTQTDYLGEGSFGKVFRGINKQTGDKVAIKTFKHLHQEISRELEMLHTLKHKYIVQLLAVEIEEVTQGTVLIMELCNGGSLMQFLNEPENVNGLTDNEFLLAVKHLTRGLMYLKRHNVIHRDVKPDNIMRHVEDGGHVIYKLADFGTARKLPEGENFTSIHGTEPYLHPHMYKASFFRHTDKEFDSSADLWSIGVTMYHVATGMLPFRVEDRNAMITIFDEIKRTEGVIAAVQEKYSDRLIFHKSLPPSSRLSSGLKQLITPIIAGLFIHDDDSKQWSFDKYHDEVEELVTRKVIKVFYINLMQVLKIYIKPEENFENFQNYVYHQTGINNSNQGFFYKRKLVIRSVEDFQAGVVDFLFLFDKTSSVVNPTRINYPDLSNFRDSFLTNYSYDLPYVYRTCKDFGTCKQLVEHQFEVYSSFKNFVDDFSEYFKEESKEQLKNYDALLEKCASISDKVKILDKIERLITKSNDSSYSGQFDTVTKNFVPRSSILFEKLDRIKNNFMLDDICYNSYIQMITKEITNMKDLYKNLYRVKSNYKYYNVEKIKIVHCVDTIWSILSEKIEPQFNLFLDKVEEWYERVFFLHLKSLQSLKKHLYDYQCNLKKFEREIQAESDKNLDIIIEKSENRQHFPKYQNFNDGFTEYKFRSGDVDVLLSENSEIIDQMNNLSLELSEEKYN